MPTKRRKSTPTSVVDKDVKRAKLGRKIKAEEDLDDGEHGGGTTANIDDGQSTPVVDTNVKRAKLGRKLRAETTLDPDEHGERAPLLAADIDDDRSTPDIDKTAKRAKLRRQLAAETNLDYDERAPLLAADIDEGQLSPTLAAHTYDRQPSARTNSSISDLDLVERELLTPTTELSLKSAKSSPSVPKSELHLESASTTQDADLDSPPDMDAIRHESTSPLRMIRLRRYAHTQTTVEDGKVSFEDCIVYLCNVQQVAIGFSMSIQALVVRGINLGRLARRLLYRLSLTGEIFHICGSDELEAALLTLYHEMERSTFILPLFEAPSSRLLRRLPTKFRRVDQMRESDFIIKERQLLPG